MLKFQAYAEKYLTKICLKFRLKINKVAFKQKLTADWSRNESHNMARRIKECVKFCNKLLLRNRLRKFVTDEQTDTQG